MVCLKCNAQNPDDKKFCGECGTALAASAVAAVPGEEGAYFCARHTKTVTRVRCGRCDNAICVKCTVHGPAGTRCRECARNRVPIRARGVLHSVGRGVGSPETGRVVWYLAVWYFIISIFTGGFGGNRD